MQRIGVLTSGGDSPGMNAAIRAVVRAAAYHGKDCFGIQHGYQGLIDQQVVPLGPRDVGGIIDRGGTILHTARCKAFFEPEGRARAADTLRAHGIEGLVVIGGDGSYRGAQLLYSEHGITCIGLPGTIDNDIGGTDFTIGYATALDTAMEAIDRVRDTAHSHDRIFFIEVMGRHNGYLAMMAGIAGGAEEVLVPETETNIDDLVARLHAGREAGKNSMIVVVAEGDEAGGAYDIAQQVDARIGFADVRVSVLGHQQRGGRPSAFDRILASRMGVRAVEALIEGESGLMVGVRGEQLHLCPLADAWTKASQFDASLPRLGQVLAV